MSITLKQDYNKGLRMAKPTVLGKTTVKPPRGSLGAISNIPSLYFHNSNYLLILDSQQ